MTATVDDGKVKPTSPAHGCAPSLPQFTAKRKSFTMPIRPIQRVSLAISLLILHAALVSAGEFNPTLSIGDPAPAWKDLPGVDGQMHSTLDLKDAKLIVVCFTCNSCPYAVDHEDRIQQLSESYRDKGVAVVAINVNLVDDDRLDAMKARAKAKSFSFSYLFDESQQIARDFGATTTPEFFLLDQQRKVLYMGSMDDSPNGTRISEPYLKNALDAALAGDQVTKAETVPIGCRIRYQRRRR